MKCLSTGDKAHDMLSHPLWFVVLFCLPILAIILSGHYAGAGWKTGVWAASLGVMGAACSANAARCGRLHCYLTGPFFLLMALITLLYGVGVLPLGASGWSAISLAVLVGGIVLSCVPEMIFGRYRENRAGTNGHR
ncbi:MAG TPA: hypothetical protein VE994_09305 [Terriglobales bacterium]|nr:hypothetical protein [Terriglobales bacterium]